MRTVGLSYSFFSQQWDDDPTPWVGKAKELGYDQLEVSAQSLQELSAWGLKRLYFESRDHQIDLSYHTYLSAGHDLSSLDEEVSKAGIAHVSEVIKTIGSLGGGDLGGVFYASWPASPPLGVDRRRNFDQSVKSLRVLLEVAESEDVMLNIEVVNRYEHYLINTVEEALQYIHAVNHPNCGLLLDTFHLSIEEKNLAEALRQAGLYLRCLHISENTRGCIGSGSIDWEAVHHALDDIHYKGPLVNAAILASQGPIAEDLHIHRTLAGRSHLETLACEVAALTRSKLCQEI